MECRRKDIRILLTSVFITENHWIGSWLTVRILKSFFTYAQFVPEFKIMSQISSSSSSHKKRKYCVNDAIDFVSSVSRLASPRLPFFLSYFLYITHTSSSLSYLGQTRSICPGSTTCDKESVHQTVSIPSVPTCTKPGVSNNDRR